MRLDKDDAFSIVRASNDTLAALFVGFPLMIMLSATLLPLELFLRWRDQ